MKKLLLLASLIGLLTACSTEKNGIEQCDEKKGYCVDFGNNMNHQKWIDNWTDQGGEPTDHSISNGFPTSSNEFVFANITSHSTCPLTETHMPIVHKKTIKNSNTRWGKVEFVQAWDPLPGQNNVFCRNLPEPNPTTAYAFCAEKDGKAVAICIQQMTDDEDMAREIFESFRWTD